jgi:hypothetical protein
MSKWLFRVYYSQKPTLFTSCILFPKKKKKSLAKMFHYNSNFWIEHGDQWQWQKNNSPI